MPSTKNSLRYAGFLYWEAVAYLMNKEYRIGMQDAEKSSIHHPFVTNLVIFQ